MYPFPITSVSIWLQGYPFQIISAPIYLLIYPVLSISAPILLICIFTTEIQVINLTFFTSVDRTNNRWIQVELSRAILEFSFNSPNNISGQNILVWVQKFVWSNQIFGRRRLGCVKRLGPKNLIRMKLLVQHFSEYKQFLV